MLEILDLQNTCRGIVLSMNIIRVPLKKKFKLHTCMFAIQFSQGIGREEPVIRHCPGHSQWNQLRRNHTGLDTTRYV